MADPGSEHGFKFKSLSSSLLSYKISSDWETGVLEGILLSEIFGV